MCLDGLPATTKSFLVQYMHTDTLGFLLPVSGTWGELARREFYLRKEQRAFDNLCTSDHLAAFKDIARENPADFSTMVHEPENERPWLSRGPFIVTKESAAWSEFMFHRVMGLCETQSHDLYTDYGVEAYARAITRVPALLDGTHITTGEMVGYIKHVSPAQYCKLAKGQPCPHTRLRSVFSCGRLDIASAFIAQYDDPRDMFPPDDVESVRYWIQQCLGCDVRITAETSDGLCALIAKLVHATGCLVFSEYQYDHAAYEALTSHTMAALRKHNLLPPGRWALDTASLRDIIKHTGHYGDCLERLQFIEATGSSVTCDLLWSAITYATPDVVHWLRNKKRASRPSRDNRILVQSVYQRYSSKFWLTLSMNLRQHDSAYLVNIIEHADRSTFVECTHFTQSISEPLARGIITELMWNGSERGLLRVGELLRRVVFPMPEITGEFTTAFMYFLLRLTSTTVTLADQFLHKEDLVSTICSHYMNSSRIQAASPRALKWVIRGISKERVLTYFRQWNGDAQTARKRMFKAYLMKVVPELFE